MALNCSSISEATRHSIVCLLSVSLIISLGIFTSIIAYTSAKVRSSLILLCAEGNEIYLDAYSAVMSANEHTDTVFECIQRGAEDYLLKPVTKKEVQYICQHVWRRQREGNGGIMGSEEVGKSHL